MGHAISTSATACIRFQPKMVDATSTSATARIRFQPKMVDATSTSDTTRIPWTWSSSENSLSNPEQVEWNPYSDVENMVIEEAFSNKETHVMLDGYHIDFKHEMQISNIDEKKQRHVKRSVCNKHGHVRAERFTFIPVDPKSPFADMHGWISPFIKEVAKDLKIKPDQLPSKDKTMISMVVEKAAHGIVEEGKLIGEQWEGEILAQILLKKKEAEMKEVWECCAHLYTLNSFLYKKLNETMRLIGSKDHEQVWRSKVRTLGPFSLLLWDNPSNYQPAKRDTILYRGVQLTDEGIASFKEDCSKKKKLRRSFSSFTSCSRIPAPAELFGNVLFIMTIKHAFTVDLTPFSQYPDEEEVLLSPGVCFIVDRMVEKPENKYWIYLNLVQQHSRTDIHEISPNAQSSDKGPRRDYVFNYTGNALDTLAIRIGTNDGRNPNIDYNDLVYDSDDYLYVLGLHNENHRRAGDKKDWEDSVA